MIGWLLLIIMIGAAAGSLRLLGLRGGLLTAAGAALLLGAAGYAFQGRPGLPGAATATKGDREALPLTDARHAFFGNFTAAESWIRISEALGRRGHGADAVGILQNAVRRYPGDAQLWIALGNALVEHGHGLTPPAEFAYQRAAEVSPGYPAPHFFYGLALARSGQRDAALSQWREILATAPPGAEWRPLVEQGVATLSAPAASAPQR